MVARAARRGARGGGHAFGGVRAARKIVGLIIVDEEQDGSYKQEEAPRYNGRDVAVMRAKLEGAVALLGSATPSMESISSRAAGKIATAVRWRLRAWRIVRWRR